MLCYAHATQAAAHTSGEAMPRLLPALQWVQNQVQRIQGYMLHLK
jgi:hypothetical protein